MNSLDFHHSPIYEDKSNPKRQNGLDDDTSSIPYSLIPDNHTNTNNSSTCSDRSSMSPPPHHNTENDLSREQDSPTAIHFISPNDDQSSFMTGNGSSGSGNFSHESASYGDNSLYSTSQAQRSYPFIFTQHQQQPFYIAVSEKLRKLRQKKERKENRKEKNVLSTFKTESLDYNVDEVLESLGETSIDSKKVKNHESKQGNSKSKKRSAKAKSSSNASKANSSDDEEKNAVVLSVKKTENVKVEKKASSEEIQGDLTSSKSSENLSFTKVQTKKKWKKKAPSVEDNNEHHHNQPRFQQQHNFQPSYDNHHHFAHARSQQNHHPQFNHNHESPSEKQQTFPPLSRGSPEQSEKQQKTNHLDLAVDFPPLSTEDSEIQHEKESKTTSDLKTNSSSDHHVPVSSNVVIPVWPVIKSSDHVIKSANNPPEIKSSKSNDPTTDSNDQLTQKSSDSSDHMNDHSAIIKSSQEDPTGKSSGIDDHTVIDIEDAPENNGQDPNHLGGPPDITLPGSSSFKSSLPDVALDSSGLQNHSNNPTNKQQNNSLPDVAAQAPLNCGASSSCNSGEVTPVSLEHDQEEETFEQHQLSRELSSRNSSVSFVDQNNVEIVYNEEEFNKRSEHDAAPVIILGQAEQDWTSSPDVEFGFELNENLLLTSNNSPSSVQNNQNQQRPLMDDKAIVGFMPYHLGSQPYPIYQFPVPGQPLPSMHHMQASPGQSVPTLHHLQGQPGLVHYPFPQPHSFVHGHPHGMVYAYNPSLVYPYPGQQHFAKMQELPQSDQQQPSSGKANNDCDEEKAEDDSADKVATEQQPSVNNANYVQLINTVGNRWQMLERELGSNSQNVVYYQKKEDEVDSSAQ